MRGKINLVKNWGAFKLKNKLSSLNSSLLNSSKSQAFFSNRLFFQFVTFKINAGIFTPVALLLSNRIFSSLYKKRRISTIS